MRRDAVRCILLLPVILSFTVAQDPYQFLVVVVGAFLYSFLSLITNSRRCLRLLPSPGLKPPVLLFMQSKERAKDLYRELVYDGINVDVIHAERTQQQREDIIRCVEDCLCGADADILSLHRTVSFKIKYIHAYVHNTLGPILCNSLTSCIEFSPPHILMAIIFFLQYADGFALATSGF
jgi:hypothetical protein